MAKKNAGGFSFDDFARDEDIPMADKLREMQKSYRCYSTGSFMLDIAIGERDPITGLPGIPERAIVEIFGINQSCKTATAEALMKNVLDADPKNKVVAVYAEEPDMDRLVGLGIDMSRVATLFCYEDGEITDQLAETQLDRAVMASQDPNVKLIVVDSLKALCSVKQLFDKKGEMKSSETMEPVAVRARLISEFILKFKHMNKRAILFMTNQTSDRIQSSPFDFLQNPKFNIQTPGGRAKEFECTLRIAVQTSPHETEKKHPLTGQGILKGWNVTYRLVKNKYSNRTANRIAMSQFLFDPPGFRRSFEVFNCADYLGLIGRNGSAIFIIEGNKIRGQKGAIKFLEDNPEIREELERRVIDKADAVFDLMDDDDDTGPMDLREAIG